MVLGGSFAVVWFSGHERGVLQQLLAMLPLIWLFGAWHRSKSRGLLIRCKYTLYDYMPYIMYMLLDIVYYIRYTIYHILQVLQILSKSSVSRARGLSARLLGEAGSLSKKCRDVAPFVNQLGPPECHAARQYLVDFVAQSQCGFIVAGVTLTNDLFLRLDLCM